MSPAPLDGIDLVVSDLDGVVYRGAEPISTAVAALNALPAGVRLVLATNNASRTPSAVAEQLVGLGLRCAPDQVVTSAMAGARLLARRLREDGRPLTVLAVGGEGVSAALEAEGLEVVSSWADGPAPGAVLQGYGPETPWSAFAEASYAIAGGSLWCLTNEDRTIPTARGIAPGNGMGGAAVKAATGADPIVAGKPETPIYELALESRGVAPRRALALGDRLDTDIAGAARLGMSSVFVPTGVHDLRDVAAAETGKRPTFLLQDLSELSLEYAEPRVVDRTSVCGEATAEWDDAPLATGGTAQERARALVALAWHLSDRGREVRAEDLPSWADL